MIQFWTACCQPAGLKCFVFSFEWKAQESRDYCAAVTLTDENALRRLLARYHELSGYALGSTGGRKGGRWPEPWYPARVDCAKKGQKAAAFDRWEKKQASKGGVSDRWGAPHPSSGGQGAGKGSKRILDNWEHHHLQSHSSLRNNFTGLPRTLCPRIAVNA